MAPHGMFININLDSGCIGRIPLIKDLKVRYVVTQNPDQSGGALLALNKKPIIPDATVFLLPDGSRRPLIGIDPGMLSAPSLLMSPTMTHTAQSTSRPEISSGWSRGGHRRSGIPFAC